jgi:hypothetical protein
MWIEALVPIQVKVGGQLVLLTAGQRIDLPKEKAERLLAQATSRVRPASPWPESDQSGSIVIDPPNEKARPIYFENVFGRIVGPIIPEFLAKVGNDFWIVSTFHGDAIWINSDRLRSKAAFENQASDPPMGSAPLL